MNYLYEVVKYNKNLPALVLMQEKPGRRCKTELHWHKELELIYMVRGHLDITCNGQEYSLDDNGLFFANSEAIHKNSVRDEKAINKYIVVMISYDFMKKFFPEIDDCFFNIDSDLIAKESIIASMMNLVYLCEDKTNRFSELMKYREIVEICCQLATKCAVAKTNNLHLTPSGNFSNAKRVMEYIGSHYSDELTLGEVAAYTELSPAYFSKYFKNITGMSFSQYLTRIRLDCAIKDMVIKNMSVTDAAFENGFPNVMSFIRSCKKTYGYTPAQYCKHFPENLM